MEAALSSLPYLMDGLLVTLQVTLLVVVFATIIGVILGVGISYGPLWLRILVRIFSDFIRGIPILVLIFLYITDYLPLESIWRLSLPQW